MKNLECNKWFGAILLVCFVVLFTSNVTEIIYEHLTEASKRGYTVEVQEESLQPKTQESSASVEFDIPKLLLASNAENGKNVAKKCAICHTFGKDEPNKTGTNLFKIYGRKVAAMSGFQYSEAMKNHGGEWNDESLFHYIYNPKKFIPGNRMAFGGISKVSDLADLIAYLKTLQ